MKKLFPVIKLLVVALSGILAFQVLSNSNDESVQRPFTLPYYDSAEFTPRWHNTEDKALESFHKISDFTLTNQQGDIVTKATVKDKIYIANFFFSTCPGICPKMRSNLFKVQEVFMNNDQVVIISHSIQPENDSVEVLQEYAQENDIIANKWHLLTGKRDDIYKLAREDYFANEDLGEYMANEDFLHTENLILIDKKGYIRGVYNGLNKASLANMLDDISLLL